MKLLTKEILKKLPPIGSTEHKKPEDVKVIVKFFHPASQWTWYATEYSPEKKMFFGYVVGFEEEYGYFSLEELESVKVRGLGIERDLFWKSETTLADVISKKKR